MHRRLGLVGAVGVIGSPTLSYSSSRNTEDRSQDRKQFRRSRRVAPRRASSAHKEGTSQAGGGELGSSGRLLSGGGQRPQFRNALRVTVLLGHVLVFVLRSVRPLIEGFGQR